MIKVAHHFEVQVYEPIPYVESMKQEASAVIGAHLLKYFPFVKISPHDHVSFKEHRERFMTYKYSIDIVEPIEYKTEFYVCSVDKYQTFKNEMRNLLFKQNDVLLMERAQELFRELEWTLPVLSTEQLSLKIKNDDTHSKESGK